MRYLILAALFTLVSSTGLAQAPPQPVDSGSWGTIKDSKFVSERLKLSLPIPPGYSILSTAEVEVLSNAGVDIVKQGSFRDEQVNEAMARSIKLLTITEKALGSPNNAALELVAAKQANGVTANMSLAANLMVLKGSPYKLKRSLGSLKLGSNVFAAAEMDVTISNVSFMLRMYVLMHNGYSIACAATYHTDQQRADLEKILAGLALTK